jgi:peptidyl-prolyl cis-trans isomerase C
MTIARSFLWLAGATAVLAQTNSAIDSTTVVGSAGSRNITVADVQKMLESDPFLATYYKQNAPDAISQFLLRQFLNEEASRRKLEEQSLVKQQLETARIQILQRALVDDERNNYPVSDRQIEAYYDSHKTQFQAIDVRAIFIPFKAAAPAAAAGTAAGTDALRAAAQAAVATASVQRTEAEAKARADEVVKKLREGLAFAKAVEEYSEDAASKSSGGDMGPMRTESPYTTDFRRAVIALKPGDISEPLKQPAGYYVCRGEERVQQSVADVRDLILDQIKNDHFNEYMQEKTKQLTFVPKDPKMLQNISPAGVPPPMIAAPPKSPATK